MRKFKNGEFQIITSSNQPIRKSFNTITTALKEKARKYIEKMLELNVIQPSRSPEKALVLMPFKKNGNRRFFFDYRKLIKSDNI